MNQKKNEKVIISEMPSINLATSSGFANTFILLKARMKTCSSIVMLIVDTTPAIQISM